jgi:curved DNA-binding protein CbpA
MRKEIEDYQALNPQNHYEVLGVDRKANTASIRSAFFQLARTWHPDRLPTDLADLKPIVTKAFAAMGDAHHTLSDERRRAEYDSALEDAPDDEQAQVAAILDAANAYQRAEVYMRKKDYTAALEQAKIAYEGDPTQADHMALYAWVQSMNGAKDMEELIGMLNKALSDNADNVRALWYRAQLLKKSGKHLMAMKDFKHIVQLKPSHTEAKRELRIFKMRKQSGAGNTQTSGFFGVFKKKD